MNKRNLNTDSHYSNVDDDDDATQKQTKHTWKKENIIYKKKKKYILRFRCLAEQF